MWSCEKNCGYYAKGEGCTINYNAETLFVMCPCYEIAVTARVRDSPTRASVRNRAREPTEAGVNDQSETT